MTDPATVEKGWVYRFGDIECDFSVRTYLMGVLNVTPDSFSDGGRFLDSQQAVERAAQMVDEGADILDIGGESTRPGSDPVSLEEETRRIIPVIESVVKRLRVVISVDTYKSALAGRALEAGATVVNDITGLKGDPAMKDVIARHGASVVLMHMQGVPKTMQEKPVYKNVVVEVNEFLKRQADEAVKAGIRQVMVDPGIGFGKTLDHNLALIKNLGALRSAGFPILVGPSRKSFLGAILNLPVDERLEGTAAAVAACIMNGASVVRVHDVKEMKRIAMVMDRIKHAA